MHPFPSCVAIAANNIVQSLHATYTRCVHVLEFAFHFYLKRIAYSMFMHEREPPSALTRDQFWPITNCDYLSVLQSASEVTCAKECKARLRNLVNLSVESHVWNTVSILKFATFCKANCSDKQPTCDFQGLPVHLHCVTKQTWRKIIHQKRSTEPCVVNYIFLWKHYCKNRMYFFAQI